MSVIGWLKDIFFGTEKEIVHVSSKIEEAKTLLFFQRFYVDLAVNMIAGAISKCEFKTFQKGKPCKGEEYFTWNYEPNANQNSTQFVQELVSKTLKHNEALIIDNGGKLIIADNFQRDEDVIRGDVFRSISRGKTSFGRDYMAKEVMYFSNANGNIGVLLNAISSGYGELLEMAIGKYRRAGGRKGVVTISKTASGNGKVDEKLDELYNKKFKSYFAEENAVLQLPSGVNYTEIHGEGSKKSTSELTDITNIMEEAAAAVGLAFKIPPALLLGKVADVDKLTENFLTFCIDPLAESISEEITRKRYGYAGMREGSYLYVDTSRIRHMDVFGTATQIDKLIASGMYSVDEIREKINEYTLDTEWSQKHWVTKNYEEITKGGEASGGTGNLSL